MESTLAERWVPAAEVSDLRNGRKVVRIEDRQIAIFQVRDAFYAVDNRCPHMGYPLSQGSISGTTLTCDWHNYKFALEDGACASRDGGEDVRAYGVRVDAGRILLNLAEEPVEQAMAKHLRSMRFAMYIQNDGRAARDAARLLTLGMRPAEVMREGALHSAEREEYGWGHALAVIADCTSMARFYEGDNVMIPVVRALTSAADPVRRYKRRQTPAPQTPDARGEQEFRRRIEEEDVDGAEAWLRGAIDGGINDRELSRWLLNAATDHFLGFGHQMIYVFKAAQLADAIGWEAMREIIPSIVPSIAWATRYDKLPEMRKYIAKVRHIEPHLASLAARQKHPTARFDAARFRGDVLFGKNDAAFEAVHVALTAGVHVDVIARELVFAASERMLRMDLDWEITHEERVWDEGGWLEVTHLLTHANANRQLLRRGVTPEALRSLYHSAWFINWQKRFDAEDGSRADAGVLPEPRAETPEDLASEYREAVVSKRMDDAMGIVRTWGRRELPKDALLAAIGREATECDDGDFIMMAHVLKTSHAAIEEHRAIDAEMHAEADLPLMAATRYLSSPRKMNPVYDLALNASKFVRSGAARSV